MFEYAEVLGANINQDLEASSEELRAVVSEICSPPRMTRAARVLKKLNITPGFALDITTKDENGEPWDFDKLEQKRKAERLVCETEPDLLMGGPMCKDFSPWQRINRAKSSCPEKYDTAKDSSRRHLEFICRVYEVQDRSGHLFLHGHPLEASSWDEECIGRVANRPGVDYVDMDQCQYGQLDHDGNPVKKPIRWLPNRRSAEGAVECKDGVVEKTTARNTHTHLAMGRWRPMLLYIPSGYVEPCWRDLWRTSRARDDGAPRQICFCLPLMQIILAMMGAERRPPGPTSLPLIQQRGIRRSRYASSS